MTIDEILEGATVIINCGKQIPAFNEYATELEADLFAAHDKLYRELAGDPTSVTENLNELIALRSESEELKKMIMSYCQGHLDNDP